MSGTNPDTPTEVLKDYPEEFEHGRLVGVDATGVPIYFEPSDQRAYEVIQSGGELEPMEERGSGPLETVIEEIQEAVGWDALTEYGEEGKERSESESESRAE